MDEQNQTMSAPQSMQAKNQLPGVIDLLKQAWEIYKEKAKYIIGILAIPFAFQLLLGIKIASFFIAKGINLDNPEQYINSAPQEAMVKLFLEMIPMVLPMMLFLGVVISICSYALLVLIIKRKNGFTIKQALSQAFNQFFKMIWTNLLVVLSIFIGSLLFIIPGILCFFWFMFSQYILVDQDLAGTKALSKSKNYVSGMMMSIIGIFIGIIFASFIATFVIGLLPKFVSEIITAGLVSPILMIALILLYENVKAIKEPKNHPEITL
jgi:hypothetical protein